MKTQLLFSLVGSCEGINPGKYYPCGMFPNGWTRAWPLETGFDSTEVCTEKEYEESGVYWNYDYCFLDPDSPMIDWDSGDSYEQVTVSGILTQYECFSFLDNIGAIYEDCQTMGTLGGPLGLGIVPDFPFRVDDAPLSTSSIRITPFLADENGEPIHGPSEYVWQLFSELFKKYDCWDLQHMGKEK